MSEILLKLYYSEVPDIEYKGQSNTSLMDYLSKFSASKNKKLDDFFFFVNGTLININESHLIKDSFQGETLKEELNIFALKKPSSIQIHVEEPAPIPEVKYNINEIEEKIDDLENFVRKKVNKIYYNDIVCPKCETTAIIEKKGLNLNVLNCENFHNIKNITFDAFDQFVYDYNNDNKEYKKKFRCNICGIPKDKLKVDKMYMCSCGCRVCDECRNSLHKPENKYSSENKGHFQVNIEDKNYYCMKHGAKNYTCYCLDCNSNLCDECKRMHEYEKHEIEYFKDIRVTKDYVKDLEEKADDHKTILLDFIDITRIIFEKIINTIDDYLNSHIMIENSMVRRFKNGQFNYQLLRNLNNKKLFKNVLFKEMAKLNDQLKTREDFEKKIKEPDFVHKTMNIIFKNIYTPINQAKQVVVKKSNQKIESNKNVLSVNYDIPGKQIDRRVKLFDPIFVENNKDNISMEISCLEGDYKKIYTGPLISEYWNNRDVNQLQVVLQEKNNGVTDMSYMLNNCKHVTNVDFSKWRMNNITSVEAIFQLCNFAKVPNIPMIDMRNLVNARAMFCKCKSITTLDNWREWKDGLWFNNKVEYKIKNMNMLFNGCINLKTVTFPKWPNYINQLEDISFMFNRCKSLTEVNHLSVILGSPNMKNLCGLFNGCINLAKISSKLTCKSLLVDNLGIMFQNCAKIQTIEVYFDNARNIRNISGMFAGCKNVRKIIPGIYYTENLINMAAFCKGCGELETLYDMGGTCKYNMSKVEITKAMFSGCKKLKTAKWLPYIKFKAGTNFDEILRDTIVDKKELIKTEWQKNQVYPFEVVEKNTIADQ